MSSKENLDNLRNGPSSSSSSSWAAGQCVSVSLCVCVCSSSAKHWAMAAQKINEAHEHIAKAEKWWDWSDYTIAYYCHIVTEWADRTGQVRPRPAVADRETDYSLILQLDNGMRLLSINVTVESVQIVIWDAEGRLLLHRETDCVISAGGYLDDSCIHWSYVPHYKH